MPGSNPNSITDARFPETRNVLESGCARCTELADSRECISWGTGDLEASIVVVGEAPGYGVPDAERWQGGNWTGKAYTSRHSGRRIRSMLERIDFAADAYYTNAVKCFPAKSDDPTDNREPSDDERRTCRVHLETELETIDPDVVLATGKHATASVLEAEGDSLDGFLETVLDPTYCEGFDVWLVPILHPSYQDVWIGRLGYEPETYLETVRETLTELLE